LSTNRASPAPTKCASSFARLGPDDRVLLVGDIRQHQGVEAGRPFQQLQEAGMRTARLDEIVRQQDPALATADSQIRFAAQAFLLEVAFLLAASFCSSGYRGDLLEHSFQPFALIALTALAMGTRNAAVRKLAIPDLTTTVLTLTIIGIGADSALANGSNPRLARRVAAVAAMFLGAALGAIVIHYSISAALWLATAISAVCGAAMFRSVGTSGSRLSR
jgi:hypothetical protein